MAEVSVWAPLAKQVELAIKDRFVSMVKDNTGWWHVSDATLQHGTDYAFRVNGSGPFPDPRAPWQPHGVHGSSRHVNHALFSWNDSGWQPPPLESGVIYELHIGTFTAEGSFDSAIERLDYLVDLGITHIELMPLAAFPGQRGWGYDGTALYAPHHPYGGPDGLKRLINACHQRGLAILLDVVYNHLGPSGNYLSQFGPYFTQWHVTPWGEAVNLDGPYSNEVRRFFIDNALMWLRDYHFDGLRIDAVHAIVDMSATHFLEQLSSKVKTLASELGRSLVLIAESDLNDPRIVRPPNAGGYGLNAQWNEDFHHALHAVLTGEQNGYYQDFGSIADLAKSLTHGFVYDGRYSTYRQRLHGRDASDLPGSRFVGCLQNHDQIGNRARGERTCHLLPIGLLKIGAALVMTAPFIPMLFQGEEWAASTPFLYFTEHQEFELIESIRKGRQSDFAVFGWSPEAIPDPQALETFQRSKLDWGELSQATHNDLLKWHRTLIQLRRQLPELHDGQMAQASVTFNEEARWLIIARGSLVVACNFSDALLTITNIDLTGKKIILASVDGLNVQNGGIALPPQAVAILG